MNAPPNQRRGPAVAFLPMNEVHECRPGDTVLDCARNHRVRIASACGGNGRCMTCTIQIADGVVPAPSRADAGAFSARRLADGWRRACEVRPTGDCTVYVPPRSTAAPVRTDVDGRETEIELAPPVRSVPFTVRAPTLADHSPDDLRILAALRGSVPDAALRFDLEVMRGLAPAVRSWDWEGQAVVRAGEVVAVAPPASPTLGLAVDLGTTNVSAMLVDLAGGTVLAKVGTENPQTAYGADLIAYAALLRREPEKARLLQSLAAEAINDIAHRLAAEASARTRDIVEVTVAGNTMMHHLLVGLPIRQLAMSPFVPALGAAADVKAREIGIDAAPGAYVHLLPNVAGFVGGDHVATLLATIEVLDCDVAIAMDIGTNTEISLVEGEKITCVSCPSGPALEGGHISHGMRAAVGAIETVRIRDGKVRLGVIGDVAPVGVCGSGVLDTVAQLYLAEVTDRRGRLVQDHPRVQTVDGKREFVLAGADEAGGAPIIFSQSDIRSVQLATGAIRAAIDQLLEAAGRPEDAIERIIIAGAFGNYVDIGSALAVGMLPELPFSRFAQVGNAAGDGARLTLLSTAMREKAAQIAQRCKYIELAGTKSFTTAFAHRINYPHRRRISTKESLCRD